jgi:hypothetical protein
MATLKKPMPTGKGTEKAANSMYPGIGRSAITGRFMSVSAARAHRKTAIVEGAGKKRKD